MSKQVSAEDVYKQGIGDRFQTSDNFEGLLENAVATPINADEDLSGVEEAAANITATGQKPHLITVDEWAEKRGYAKDDGGDDESVEKPKKVDGDGNGDDGKFDEQNKDDEIKKKGDDGSVDEQKEDDEDEEECKAKNE